MTRLLQSQYPGKACHCLVLPVRWYPPVALCSNHHRIELPPNAVDRLGRLTGTPAELASRLLWQRRSELQLSFAQVVVQTVQHDKDMGSRQVSGDKGDAPLATQSCPLPLTATFVRLSNIIWLSQAMILNWTVATG